MKYADVVKEAKHERKKYNDPKGKAFYAKCQTWLDGEHINLWTYWQGYQLKDIDEKGVDILLVGQDWGNPLKNTETIKRIEDIRKGEETLVYREGASKTDDNLADLFEAFDVDIRTNNPGKRLFFTNYSLGYRSGNQSGGMTKGLMRQDEKYFKELVMAIRPKIIICLGKITYEVASGQIAKNFSKKLLTGIPFMHGTLFSDQDGKELLIPVYGVAHCGSWGTKNAGDFENQKKVWSYIAKQYKQLEDK